MKQLINDEIYLLILDMILSKAWNDKKNQDLYLLDLLFVKQAYDLQGFAPTAHIPLSSMSVEGSKIIADIYHRIYISEKGYSHIEYTKEMDWVVSVMKNNINR